MLLLQDAVIFVQRGTIGLKEARLQHGVLRFTLTSLMLTKIIATITYGTMAKMVLGCKNQLGKGSAL